MDLSKFVRRDISGIRKDILPLSGFGLLSHALADEIAARNQAREGYFYTTEMEFLEEAEPEQPPVLPPVSRQPETIRMDMTLLFKLVQENRETGRPLPAGTQKMLERVRTILKTTPQGGARPAPQTVRRMEVPQSGMARDRMQNPLRDPKAPLAVEKMHTPSHEVPRASDHAMLFSDVLHRAQDSGLTFAARAGQGGVPASARTRTAYTAQAIRKAKAEQQAAEERSVPVWQRTAPREVSRAASAVPETLRKMAAPRYPETELNFVQDEPQTAERAELSVPTARRTGAESLRAVQEASAKALAESVRSALNEAAPLMTAAAQETARQQSAPRAATRPGGVAQNTVQTERAATNRNAEGAGSRPASATAASPQERNAAHPGGTASGEGRTGREIPPKTDAAVENRPVPGRAGTSAPETAMEQKPAAGRTGAGTASSAKDAYVERAMTAAAGRAEQAGTEAAPDVQSAEALRQIETLRQNAGETPTEKTLTQSRETAGDRAEMPDGERLPALDGDRAFAQTPAGTTDFVRQMAAPRYPETELNFVQDEPQTAERAELSAFTAQRTGAESLRAVQEASAVHPEQ